MFLYLNKNKTYKLPLQAAVGETVTSLQLLSFRDHIRTAAFVIREAMLNFNKDNIVPRCRMPQQVCIKTSVNTTFPAHRGPGAHERNCHISLHAPPLPATSEPPNRYCNGGSGNKPCLQQEIITDFN